MAEGSERSAPIDRPSWTVNTPLRILTQQTNGLPGRWQPDSRPRTIPAPLGVMDKRNPSICQYVTSGAYLLPQPFHQSAPHGEGALTPALLAQPVIFHLSAHFFFSNHSSCVSHNKCNHSERGGCWIGRGAQWTDLTPLHTLKGRSCNTYTNTHSLFVIWFNETDFCSCPSACSHLAAQ